MFLECAWPWLYVESRCMKKKLTPVLVLAALLVIIAAVWQAHEAATLEERLLEIDRRTQTERLLALSLPEVESKLQSLLQEDLRI